jgi:NAD(P) transhydrogenase subunit alpha
VIIGVPTEIYPGERRVALVPAVLPTLTKAGFEVHIQSGAGVEAGYPDFQYSEKGAKIVADRAAVFASADILAQVLCYGANDITGKQDVPLLRRDQLLVGFLRPFGSLDTVQEVARTGVTAFSVELMPRTTRAQSMDALSSMATVAGYKAVLVAADSHPRIFPMLTTWTPGNRNRAPSGCCDLGLRSETRSQGASAESRRTFCRASDRGERCAGCTRICPRTR